MLNRENVRKVLVAEKIVIARYACVEVNYEDIPMKTFLEEVLKEVLILEKNETKKDKK